MSDARELQPEVAAVFELTDSGHTRFYVPRLNREVDLSTISLAEARQLVALPDGFEWLRKRKPAAAESDAAAPTVGLRAKSKSGAPGGEK